MEDVGNYANNNNNSNHNANNRLELCLDLRVTVIKCLGFSGPPQCNDGSLNTSADRIRG